MARPKTPTQATIVYHRKLRGLTQADLGHLLQEETGDELWTRKRVHRLEADDFRIDVDLLQALSRVLEVDYATLIDGYHPQEQRAAERTTSRSQLEEEIAGQTEHADDFNPTEAVAA